MGHSCVAGEETDAVCNEIFTEIKKRDFRAAAGKLETLLSADPDLQVERLMLATCYMGQEDPLSALICLKQCPALASGGGNLPFDSVGSL